MANFITNADDKDLKKRLVELVAKSQLCVEGRGPTPNPSLKGGEAHG